MTGYGNQGRAPGGKSRLVSAPVLFEFNTYTDGEET